MITNVEEILEACNGLLEAYKEAVASSKEYQEKTKELRAMADTLVAAALEHPPNGVFTFKPAPIPRSGADALNVVHAPRDVHGKREIVGYSFPRYSVVETLVDDPRLEQALLLEREINALKKDHEGDSSIQMMLLIDPLVIRETKGRLEQAKAASDKGKRVVDMPVGFLRRLVDLGMFDRL